ncbi:MAG TPA: AlkA N-terminal domain-containing protein [Verrucomicrobiae bacterium]|jgi:AraC family transcriptional regulator of adaptative response / DNA-3-methyladenine glycosylase II
MQLDPKILYQALLARDTRFDGTFFTGVTSTGIYCRPICPVKPPKLVNCRFYEHAPEAESAGFRPCLRCRPELAPGNAPVDNSKRIAHRIVQRIEAGNLEEKAALEAVADEFKLSSRQIRRIIQKELGVAPIRLLLTRRLLLAKQLLTETKLPVIEIAFASGFASLRRFNDAFNRRYGMPPTRLRRSAAANDGPMASTDTITLQLAYRPPYDWPGVLAFLKTRELKGVEWVTEHFYARTVQLGEQRGWIKVTLAPKKNALLLEFTHNLIAGLPALLRRVRDLFDLDARPDVIAKHFEHDQHLASIIKANPGLRVPGAFHGFELGLRAILGQQITVKAATTIAGRMATAFGEPITTPYPELNRLTPSAGRIAKASVDSVAKLGIVKARCQSLIALAKAQKSGEASLDDDTHSDPEEIIRHLVTLPGIGQWTAHYIAMRALRWPDAFPKEDIIVRRELGGVTAKQAEELAKDWRPWRSYAVLHLWRKAKQSSAAF